MSAPSNEPKPGDATRGVGQTFALLAGRLGPYGMLLVLFLLVALFSILTIREQQPTGARAARSLSGRIPAGERGVLYILVRGGAQDDAFAARLGREVDDRGDRRAVVVVRGDPAAWKRGLEARGDQPGSCLVATLEAYAPAVRSVIDAMENPGEVEIVTPSSYRWPTFLLTDNLRNVANQIAVIAIVAVGMTLVILTGGIDLSVGSLIAFSAVVATGLIGQWGAEQAGPAAMLLAGLAAIVACALCGLLSGFTITRFGVPPFIATLGMMQVASGIAYILSKGRPIYQVPESFVTLGRATDPVMGIPWAVWLMLALFAAAHLVMARTVLGRSIYAVGGNAEAARLAGVRVKGVLLLVYVGVAALAGLGGVVMASQLKSGAPTYGGMYELYVIAAVVVGGTSLSGGEGRVLGTLIGAFIIAVIQNGMNLTNVESYTQKVVLGLVILGAVLLDRLKHEGIWRRKRTRREA